MEKLRQRVLHTSFQDPEGAPERERILENLRSLRGVRCAHLDLRTGALMVVYNLLEAHLGEILGKLEESGLSVKGSTFQKARLKVACFVEKNEQNNLTAPIRPCCSHPELPAR